MVSGAIQVSAPYYRVGYADTDHSVTSIPYNTWREAVSAAEKLAKVKHHVWIRRWPSGDHLWDEDRTFGHWEAGECRDLPR